MQIRGQSPISRTRLGFWLLIAASVGYRLVYLNYPFQRDPEGCGSFYGLLARNYLLWPLKKTLGVPVESLGIGHGVPWFYPNHPPLLPIFISIVFAIFGPGEWQTRFSSGAFTVGCAAVIYHLLRHRSSSRAALLAAFFFLVSPMALLFGGQPDVINSQLVFFVLLTIAAYMRFYGTPNIRTLLLMSLSFAAAAFSDWPAYFLSVVLGIHFVCTRPWKTWGWIFAFAGINVICFAIPYCQGIAVTHELHWMTRFVERRTISSDADSTGAFTAMDWVQKAILGHAYNRHNGPILPLMLGWIAMALTRWRRRPETLLIALTLGWAAVHVIVGRQGVYVHEWWWWPLTPGAAMAAGVMGDGIWLWTEQKLRIFKSLSSVIVAALIGFAALNVTQVQREWANPKQITNVSDPLNYSLAEIGEAIRRAAPPNTAVAVGEKDPSLAFWYYADRPLMQDIWDPETLQRRVAERATDLPFAGIQQQWTGPVSAYLLPRVYVSPRMTPMIEWMDRRWERADTEKFLIWKMTVR